MSAHFHTTRRTPERVRGIRSLIALAVLQCGYSRPATAVDQIIVEVGEISAPRVHASGTAVLFDLGAPSPQTTEPASKLPSAVQTVGARVKVGHLEVSIPTSPSKHPPSILYSSMELSCPAFSIALPSVGCQRGTLAAQGGPTGRLSLAIAGSYDSADESASIHGSGLVVAGATVRFSARSGAASSTVNVDTGPMDLAALWKLASPWVALPVIPSLAGHVALRATTQLKPSSLRAQFTAQTPDLNFANEAGTLAGQALAGQLSGTVTRAAGVIDWDLQLRGASGQTLAGPVLLDFGANPLELRTHARLGPTPPGASPTLVLSQTRVEQRDLLQAQGEAQVMLGEQISLTQAHVDVQRLQLPSAYRSFAQLTLAATDFGALNASGSASGSVDFTHGDLQQISVRLENVALDDPGTRFSLSQLSGQLHWTADPAHTDASELTWNASSAYGLRGGAVRLRFIAGGTNFTLLGDTRLPIFDGALIVHTLAVRHLGAPDTELDFDAHLEPISMPLLSVAFGWPTLSGQLAGRIPGVTYRDRVLAFGGDLSASVFDGTIVGSRLRLSDPFGPWPRLQADVSARGLDLDLLTHTFSIGSITGRLDADIKGLELFNWSPVSFDARLYTSPGDRTTHLISQKAVTSISGIGGGGGGVTAALQSGVLRFFKTFHYDQIGMRCQLREEVCLMSGIEPTGTGYYLVKGRGIPRIDIIGNAGRVDWTQLAAQIAAGMHAQNVIIR